MDAQINQKPIIVTPLDSPPPPPPPPVEFIKPWTIKGVFPEDRNAAIQMAEREDVVIGDWISRAIRHYAKAQLDQTRLPVVTTPVTPVSVDELVQLADLAQRVNGEVPKRLKSRINRIIREKL